MTGIQLSNEAEKRGKVSFGTWLEAKRLGIDPDSLREREQAAHEDYLKQKREYAQYVYGGKKS